MKVKINDIVICINPSCDLKKNRKYKVVDIDNYYNSTFYDVVDQQTNQKVYGMYHWRFMPAPQNSKPNQNMKLKCIKTEGSSNLKHGQIYTVVDTNEHGNISVKDQNGRILTHYYKPDRFMEVAEKIASPQFDLSKEYQTKDGKKVKILTLSNDPKYPIVGMVEEVDGNWYNQNWTLDGKLYHGENSQCDIVEVRPKQYTMEDMDGVMIDFEKFENWWYDFDQLRKILKEIDK